MRYVSVDSIEAGMILGKPLIGKNDGILLKRGAVLQISYINKIKELGYNGIYVEDDLSRDIQIPEIIDENLRFEAIKTVKESFMNIERWRIIPPKTFNTISGIINSIVDSILTNRDAMVNLIDLKLFDDYTYYHSVNVCILSLVIGVAFNFNKSQLYDLGLASALHDIGKIYIPKEILNKKDKLTREEFEIIKTHSSRGYIFVKDNSDIPPVSYVAILHHHEKYDGSGYPSECKGDNISLFGRIISIADVYDAITSDRPYRKALPPYEAIEYIMGNGGIAFDPNIVKVFTRKIAPYPVGTSVRLSNNKIGLVVENYTDCCTRPKIKIYKHGDKVVAPYFIDLKNDLNTVGIVIAGIV